MSSRAFQVWQQFTGSMQQGNNHWQDLIADDITFTGPMDQVEGKADFIKLNQDFFKIVRGYDIHRHICDDNTVVTECTLRVSSPKGTDVAFDLAEIYSIEDGKIKSVNIYWDPREFAQAFSG